MHLFELLRKYFAEYGYWTVAVILLLENAGIPLPGETTLLFAAFLRLSQNHHRIAASILRRPASGSNAIVVFQSHIRAFIKQRLRCARRQMGREDG